VRDGLVDQGEVAVQRSDEAFFLNHELIKQDYSTLEVSEKLMSIMRRLGAGEIAFTRPAMTEADCRAFLARFQTHYRDDSPTDMLQERFPFVRLRAIDDAAEDAFAEVDGREAVARAYALLSVTLAGSLNLLRSNRSPRLVQVRKAIHSLADAAVGHESLLVGLTRFPNLTGAPHHHLAAVTALTMLEGRRLRLSRRQLSQLCLAAALHDIGRMELGRDPISHAEEQAWVDAMQRVPLRSLLHGSRGSLSEEALGIAAVTYEHGLELELNDDLGPCVMARLIAVPCAFDLACSAPPPRTSLSPDRVVRMLRDRAGRRFDPRVVRVFTSIVGAYPVGTLVRLSGGEIAIVVEAPADAARWAQPVVKIVGGKGGGYLLDLGAPDAGREIVQTLDPAEARVNTVSFLLA
jgi:hypothetical protein